MKRILLVDDSRVTRDHVQRDRVDDAESENIQQNTTNQGYQQDR